MAVLSFFRQHQGNAVDDTTDEFASPLARPAVAKVRPSMGQDLRPGKSRLFVWLISITVLVFFLWAANAPLEEVTRGEGKVIPNSRGQIIQSLEGGILKSIEINEGDDVEAGQVLAVIDDTKFKSEYTDLQGQIIALRASLDRLYAELNNKAKVEFHPEVEKAGDIVLVERHLFEARQRKQQETVSNLKERVALAEEQIALVKPVVARGAASRIEGIRLEKEAADLRGQLGEIQNTYYQEITDEIAKKSAELASLNEQRLQKLDALSRTDLKSPVRGTVKNLSITTRGGVVQPGETIMEIVPLDDQLYVEAEIRPRDVAFLHPGLPATVKITAYDYATYGQLNGKLVFISADTIKNEEKREQEPFYRVRILTDKAALQGPEGPLPIKPGMVAEVNIQTGSKTVLDYLLQPILKGQEAMTER
ncbi:HlyD family type I secretion periplasmic adaptor subunit [Brucella anthropi]|uniref:HlyD family type I secretion periplasmic adaptor subunit n=1 Tax=Brucella anthropi TaxID=529 RepID=UPI00384B03EB